MSLKQDWLRIEDLRLFELGQPVVRWLHTLPDVEYREDYCSFFVVKGSLSHTLIALKLGDVFT